MIEISPDICEMVRSNLNRDYPGLGANRVTMYDDRDEDGVWLPNLVVRAFGMMFITHIPSGFSEPFLLLRVDMDFHNKDVKSLVLFGIQYEVMCKLFRDCKRISL